VGKTAWIPTFHGEHHRRVYQVLGSRLKVDATSQAASAHMMKRHPDQMRAPPG
jgi:hypothetical protein